MSQELLPPKTKEPCPVCGYEEYPSCWADGESPHPMHELERLKFAIASLAEVGHAQGSYAKEQAYNAGRGIIARLEWVIQRLKGGDR